MADRILYRVHSPRYAYAPLSGVGAAGTGGRWNQPGKEALYLSADPTTAMIETQPVLDAFKPITLISYVLGSARLFDTRDPTQQATYGITPDLLATDWYTHAINGTISPTWSLVERLRANSFQGLSYASMHNGLETWSCGTGTPETER